MIRLQKILAAVVIIVVVVISLSLIVSVLIKPNQLTPIKKILPAQNSNAEASNSLAGAQTVAAWIWQSPQEMLKNLDPMVEFAKSEGINTFYVYIDDYVDIIEMPNGSEKDQKLSDYTKALKTIVSKSKENGISVHALSGNTTYSYDSHSYIPPLLITHIFDFNLKNPDTKIDGIQFDIEFYEDDRFFGSTKEYTQSYLTLVTDLAKQVKQLNDQYQDKIRLGFVIPFWLDETNDYLEKPIIGSLIDSLSVTQNPYLVVMAYRNVIDGEKGVLALSNAELKLANGSNVKIIIAQELVENKDSKITHFGESKKEINEKLSNIIEGAKDNPSFEGISIHDLPAFMQTY